MTAISSALGDVVDISLVLGATGVLASLLLVAWRIAGGHWTRVRVVVAACVAVVKRVVRGLADQQGGIVPTPR